MADTPCYPNGKNNEASLIAVRDRLENCLWMKPLIIPRNSTILWEHGGQIVGTIVIPLTGRTLFERTNIAIIKTPADPSRGNKRIWEKIMDR